MCRVSFSSVLTVVMMKRPTMLLATLLTELGEQCSLPTVRDVEYIQHRVKCEGLSFLTITLPTFDDFLIEGLERGRFPLSACSAFKHARKGGLPHFMSGFLKRIFDKDGFLLSQPDPDCIYAVRQVCRLYKKVLLECSENRLKSAITSYVETDRDLTKFERRTSAPDRFLSRVCDILWGRVFSDADSETFIPRHGPGATAEYFSANKRNRIRYWYTRFEGSFPLDLYAIPNAGWHSDLAGIDLLDLKDELPVRVVFVPKTLKSPRVIAVEPSTVQFVQQGILGYMVPALEKHRLTRQSVHFSDQSANMALARAASKDRRLATIDLSEASDRVSLSLVQSVFRRSPILSLLEDSRSLHADVPGVGNLILNKFASMGSALCFPVEACVFYSLIQAAIHIHTGTLPCAASIERFSRSIDVYGDDIIIPTRFMGIVTDYLELHGLKVNRSKSFSKGNFRESCGGDYFNGVDVKPIYVRQLPPDQSVTLEPSVVMSLASTSDQFYMNGLWKTCQLMRDWIETQVGQVPRNLIGHGGLVFKSVWLRTRCSYHASLHKYVQRCVVYSNRRIADTIDDDSLASLNAVFRVIGVKDHYLDLLRSVKRGAFRQKRRWITAQ